MAVILSFRERQLLLAAKHTAHTRRPDRGNPVQCSWVALRRMMVLLAPVVFLLLTASGVAEGQITVANQGTVNPTLLYRGKPVFKIGPLPEVVPFAVQWDSNDFPHERWLDWMHGHRLGYGRVYPESGYPWVPCDADKRLFPFKVVRRQNGRPIVDLNKFDSAYWHNFARVIKECADRGIILQMQIFN